MSAADTEPAAAKQPEAKQPQPKRQPGATSAGEPDKGPAPAADEFTGAIGTANERLQEVLQAADRAARQILEDARAEARRHVAEERERAQRITQEKLDRLAEKAEEIVRRAEAAGRQLAEFTAAVEAAGHEEFDVGRTPPAADADPPASEAASADPGGAEHKEGRVRRVSLFRTRQVASQGAARGGADRSQEIVARIAQWKSWGMSRARIEAMLVEEFRVKNPAAVLDSLERSRPR